MCIGWRCWRILGSVMTLRVLFLALRADHRFTMVPTWLRLRFIIPLVATGADDLCYLRTLMP
jgi:hypothetical protein